MSKRIGKLGRDTRGATAIEYGVITALLALIAIGAMVALSGRPAQNYAYPSHDLNAPLS